MLRAKGVVRRFVEFYGPGLASRARRRSDDRQMAPEYGAPYPGFFPIASGTLRIAPVTGRTKSGSSGEGLLPAQGLWRDENSRSRCSPTRSSRHEHPSSRRWPGRGDRRTGCCCPTRDHSMPSSSRPTTSKRPRVPVEARITTSATANVVIAPSPAAPISRNHRVLVPPDWWRGSRAKGDQSRGQDRLAPGSKVVRDYLDATASARI